MSIRVFGYDKCDTCRKAWRWLAAEEVPFERVSITTSPPSRDELERAWKSSGLPLKKFFNTAGRSYRSGGWSDRFKSGVSEAEQLDALSADPMLIKRPLLVGSDQVLVGFKPAVYAAAFGR